MENVFFDKSIERNNKTRIIIYVFSFILILFLALVLKSRFSTNGILIILAIVLSFLTIYNIYFSYSILLLLLFTPYILPIHNSILFSFFVAITLVFTYSGNFLDRLNKRVLYSFLIYFLCTLPSFFVTSKPLYSLFQSTNLFAFFVIMITTMLIINTPKKMTRVLYAFIFAVLIHSFIVIYQGMTTGERVFGLLGVFFVDLAGLGTLLSIILFFQTKGLNKLFFGIITLIIFFALILTQTRNAWLSLAVSFIALVTYLIIYRKKYQINIISISLVLVILFFGIVFSYSVVSKTNVAFEKRLDLGSQTLQLSKNTPKGGVNSFISRIFIWHTAYMAFLKHPITGIGLYSFKYTSNEYYKIPKSFYKGLVAGRTPHQTYIEILTETGVIGFIGFSFFIFSLIRLIISSLKFSGNIEDNKRTLLICWSFIYILFSMFMTEAWLYGQLLIWFGILIGLLSNNQKLLKKGNKSFDFIG